MGVKNNGNNVALSLVGQKSMKDVSESIGETERTTQRLIKLNELIPEIQSFVSSGDIGVRAAEQLARNFVFQKMEVNYSSPKSQ
ncbi:hypothetical protein [Paenibacillus sp. CFBP 13594]|uniref:hypothetical protein n=1 Tax=Paenibacillus sp. CFBP 13594 TaxID=2774037 RepID=UPI001A7EC0FB|nr:hypothetical protein [Paenibacillus sp. CFBP 13594]